MTIPPRAAAILAQVAANWHVSTSDLLGRDRRRFAVRPRQEAWARLYALRTGRTSDATYSLPQIGGWFDRDHTTVLHGIRAHEKRQAEGRA